MLAGTQAQTMSTGEHFEGHANGQSKRMILPAAAALAALVVVVLGSLTPFQLVGPAPITWRLGELEWHRLKFADALANFVIYVPVGALLVAWWRRALGSAGAALVAIAFAGGMSLALESTQAMIATRYASWYDLLLNVFGAVVGAVVAALLAPTVAFLWHAIVHVSSGMFWRRVVGGPLMLIGWLVIAAAVAADGVRGLAAVLRDTATLHGATIPLVDYFYQPIGSVALWLGELAVVYAALVWMCAAVWKRYAGRAGGLRWSVLLLTIASAIVGIVEVNGRWSVSDAIVAALAMIVSLAAHRDLSRQRCAEVLMHDERTEAAKQLERARQQEANAIARRRAFGSAAAGLTG